MLNLQFIPAKDSEAAASQAGDEQPAPKTSARNLTSPRCSILVRRFWRFGIAIAIAVLIVLTGVQVRKHREGDPRLTFGHDLLPSYTAGVLVRSGNARLMYDRAEVESLEANAIAQANLQVEHRYGAWLNPPFFAWLFVPLAGYEYRTALAIFVAFNTIIFLVALRLLKRMLTADGSTSLITSHHLPTRTWALVPLLILIAGPTIQAVGHQQNTFISLLLLSAAVALARSGSGFAAGLVAGLLFFKPQLALVISLVVVLLLGWRALAGVAVTGLSLLTTTLITMPGCITEYQHRLPIIVHWLQKEIRYNWGRQVTFTSFWRLLIQGHDIGEHVAIVPVLVIVCSGAFAVALGWLIVKCWGDRNAPATRDRLISAAIVTMPLLMPYYMDYDLTLLAVPAVLLAAEWIRKAETAPLDQWLLQAWVVLYLLMYINPGLAGATRLNLAVPAIAAVAGLSIARCYNPPPCRQTATLTCNS